jgi:hypothetical protein
MWNEDDVNALRDLMQAKWEGETRSASFEQLQDKLAVLALAMIDQDRPYTGSLSWALQQMSGAPGFLQKAALERLLQEAHEAQFLHLTDQTLEFTDPLYRTYFAAVRLLRERVHTRISAPDLTHDTLLLFGRRPGKWDDAVRMAARFPTGDDLIRQVATVDPLLAAICVMEQHMMTAGRQATIEALWSWVNTTRPGTLWQRREAMAALYFIADDRQVEALIRVLNTDPDFDVRISAAYTLGHILGPTAVSILLDTYRQITDKDVMDAGTVQYKITDALVKIGIPAVAGLINILQQTTDHIDRWRLVEALVKISGGDSDLLQGGPLLTALAPHAALEEGPAADTLIAALTRIGTPEAKAYVQARQARRSGS